LPINQCDMVNQTGFQIKYLMYTFMTVYLNFVYLGMTHTFIFMFYRIPENKSAMLFIALGCNIFFLYFFVICFYAILKINFLSFFGMIMVLLAQFLFFLGFLIPSLRRNKVIS
jgi:hypothetical protein